MIHTFSIRGATRENAREREIQGIDCPARCPAKMNARRSPFPPAKEHKCALLGPQPSHGSADWRGALLDQRTQPGEQARATRGGAR